MPFLRLFSFTLMFFALLMASTVTSAQEAKPLTIGNPQIPLEELNVRLIPLTTEELRVEANAWQARLQSSVTELGDVEIAILRGEANPEDDQAMQDEFISLAERRQNDIERLELVLDHLTEKIGLDEASQEPAEVQEMRRYISSVDGIRSGVVDAGTFLAALSVWMADEDGGIRVLKNLGILLGVTFFFWFVGKSVARAINKALDLSGKSSKMLKDFNARNIPNALIVIGFLTGLAILDVNITPLVAMIGGASFVLAFALQDTLSNFASGVMIMFYKPFDVDDYVDVAGIQGSVKSMTLVSTTISTLDNQTIVVPNNSIWGNVITNITGVKLRRVDLTFGIGYADDMSKAEAILKELAVNHPKTLDEPEPLIKVHELADSSVNFICRPWVKTEDYWDVYWDLTRAVKERFDADGVSIPFPQRDVHLYKEE